MWTTTDRHEQIARAAAMVALRIAAAQVVFVLGMTAGLTGRTVAPDVDLTVHTGRTAVVTLEVGSKRLKLVSTGDVVVVSLDGVASRPLVFVY